MMGGGRVVLGDGLTCGDRQGRKDPGTRQCDMGSRAVSLVKQWLSQKQLLYTPQ